MSGYATLCAMPGCPLDAVAKGRCREHKRPSWEHQSPSSRALNGPDRRQHRAERARAAYRSKGACEDCGRVPEEDAPPLQFHHPEPISQGGALVQPDARLLCDGCHLRADRKAGARR